MIHIKNEIIIISIARINGRVFGSIYVTLQKHSLYLLYIRKINYKVLNILNIYPILNIVNLYKPAIRIFVNIFKVTQTFFHECIYFFILCHT